MYSRLPKETQKLICELYEEGWPVAQISKRVGHCQDAVSKVVKLAGLNKTAVMKELAYRIRKKPELLYDGEGVLDELSSIFCEAKQYRQKLNV